MVYTDLIHIVADTKQELHGFAKSIGLKRHFYEGVRKGHPHYDITSSEIYQKVINSNIQIVNSRVILLISKSMK